MRQDGSGGDVAERRVLAIDGGGVRGLVAAVILDALEGERRALGATRPLADCFDLIAGTSTGAIIAAGLAAPDATGTRSRRSAAELRDLYRRDARRIFPRRYWRAIPLIGIVRQLFGPLYSAKPFERVLSEHLGDTPLSAARRNLLITSYAIDPREIMLFRGGPAYREAGHGAGVRMTGARLVDAVIASASAPTYFPPRRVVDQRTGEDVTAIDGGVYVNNPALLAFAEAVRLFPGDDVRVVSIGSGRLLDPYPYRASRRWGFWEWISPIGRYRTPLLSAIADGQSRAVNLELEKLAGEDYFTRFDYDLMPERGSPNLDDASARNLKRLERGALQEVEAMRPRLKALAKALG